MAFIYKSTEKVVLKEVKLPYVQEIINEKAGGNIFQLFSKNSLIYGGAARDAIAGFPLVGDIDVVVSDTEFRTIYNNFMYNHRWREVPLTKTAEMKSKSKYMKSTSYIQDIKAFETINGCIVQIMVYSEDKCDPVTKVPTIVSNVDFKCCGMIVKRNGHVFEAIPGALDDCLNRILTINKVTDKSSVKKFLYRHKKLTNRGWSSSIDIEKVKKEIKELFILTEKKKIFQTAAAKKKSKNKTLNVNKAQESLFGKAAELINAYGGAEWTTISMPKFRQRNH